MRRPLRKPHGLRMEDVDNWEETANYLIYTDGSDYIAVNGNTGKEDIRNVTASTVIQYALDNLTSGRTHRETVAFKGAFTITAAIDIPSYTTLDFKGATLTLGNTAGVHMLQIGDGTTGVVNVEIMHGRFDGNRANQAGIKHCIHVQDKCQKLNFHDNYFTGWYGKAVNVEGGGGAGICYDVSITNNMMNDFEAGIDADGIDLDQVYYAVISNNIIRDAADDGIDCGSVVNLAITNNILKDCVNGIEIYASAGAITGNAIDKATGVGIVADMSMLSITGNYLRSIYTHGINLRGGHDCTVVGNTFWRCSWGANNTYDDICLQAKGAEHSLRNVISNNVSVADGAQKVKHMIEEVDANQDYNIITDNINTGAVTAMILKSGANTIVSNNLGHVTENGGVTGNVADGGTFAHGLVSTPTYCVVTGTVTGDLVSVSALGAANVTVAIKDEGGGAGTAQPLYWRAWV